MPAQPIDEPTVFIVDDDADVREGLKTLLRSVGLNSVAFASTAEFLQARLPDTESCLILDVRLPGLSGLDFQAKLAHAHMAIPIIFITGHGDIPMTVRAMKAGAVEFLTKPFREQDLLDAISLALERDRERRARDVEMRSLLTRFEALNEREQQVMALVTQGLLNKQAAAELGLSEVTVKIYRRRLMRKMGVKSMAGLVRAADALGIGRKATSAG
jgi:FixJ family two-component response regulator